MTGLPDKLRTEAQELQQAAQELLAVATALPDGVLVDEGNLAATLNAKLDEQHLHSLKAMRNMSVAIIGMVRASNKSDLADALEYQQAKTVALRIDEKRRSIVEKSDQMRNAVAKGIATGDWSDYDKQFGRTGNHSDTNDGDS